MYIYIYIYLYLHLYLYLYQWDCSEPRFGAPTCVSSIEEPGVRLGSLRCIDISRERNSYIYMNIFIYLYFYLDLYLRLYLYFYQWDCSEPQFGAPRCVSSIQEPGVRLGSLRYIDISRERNSYIHLYLSICICIYLYPYLYLLPYLYLFWQDCWEPLSL